MLDAAQSDDPDNDTRLKRIFLGRGSPKMTGYNRNRQFVYIPVDTRRSEATAGFLKTAATRAYSITLSDSPA